MKKYLLLSTLVLMGCESKDSNEVKPESFLFKDITLTAIQLDPNYAGKTDISYTGRFPLYEKEQGKVKLSGQDKLIFTGPDRQTVAASNIPKTSTSAEQCCQINISSYPVTSHLYANDNIWEVALTRNSKVIESFDLSLPQMIQFIYPGAASHYEQFIFSGNDVVLTWYPDTAKDLIKIRFSIATQSEGSNLCSGEEFIEREFTTNLSDLNGELVIPADIITLCPQPIDIQVTFSFEDKEKRVVQTKQHKNTVTFFDFKMQQRITLKESVSGKS
ncbi:hypothetical protein CWB99_08505 [Pseudoalteromonas rubra]|uniref:Lipoprotein n=1 Tax=Pseudoalteromonas rubra TaxID=43658 RepID=A0A5S3WN75_9GAMM|nr:hypothetical protein [Pseudoalteromonas rubra]TMP29632.1 hypothetical protein CWB99_08505 [Pseudoalteromonas rubra]TMP35225.1 hypothetical protein CWC00_05470 [Pseudoalteromonas rubra]